MLRIRYFLGAAAVSFMTIQDRLKRHDPVRSGRVVILLYHAVPTAELAQLRAQLTELGTCYSFITPAEFHAFMCGELPLIGTHLLVTFDDGFHSSFSAAGEVLEPLGIKALFFVPVGFVGLTGSEWKSFASENIFHRRLTESEIGLEHFPMTWDDLRRLSRRGHAIGSHTFNHPSLSALTDADLHHEVSESGDSLERELGITVVDFAFPLGRLNTITARALQMIQRRYRFCHSSLRGENRIDTQPGAILRQSVEPKDPAAYVRFLIEGGLAPRYRKSARRLAILAEQTVS